GGLPGGGGGMPGGDDLSAAERKKLQAALKACGGDRAGGQRAGGRGGRTPNVKDPSYQKAIRAYVACVRKKGFDLPDPDFSGKGPVFDSDEVDQTDATFRKASAACQSTLRQGSGGNAAP
ncbi:hypothetical protein ACVU7I_01950, partial [Patulibacter sp. S7RM1-6]